MGVLLQLNYFSWVRLGKGRQRESSYTNEDVIVLDDILHLKRRPNTGKARVARKGAISLAAGCSDDSSTDENIAAHSHSRVSVVSSSGTAAPPVLNVSHSKDGPLMHRQSKRRRGNKRVLSGDASTSSRPHSQFPQDNNLISEDDCEESKKYSVSLDLTMPDLAAAVADKDVLTCCQDLLQLASGQGWK